MGVVVLLVSAGLSAAFVVFILRFIADNTVVVPILLVTFAALVLASPVVWQSIILALRRKAVSTWYRADLVGALWVEVEILYSDAVIAKDAGFLKFEGGCYAFFGLKERYAISGQETKLLNMESASTVTTWVWDPEGQSIAMRYKSWRLPYLSRRPEILAGAIVDCAQKPRPDGWSSVFPPLSVDPEVEVTKRKLSMRPLALIALLAVPLLVVLTIVTNLVRGHSWYDDIGWFHAVAIVPAMFLFKSETCKMQRTFEIHKAIREGNIGLEGLSDPAPHTIPRTKPAEGSSNRSTDRDVT